MVSNDLELPLIVNNWSSPTVATATAASSSQHSPGSGCPGSLAFLPSPLLLLFIPPILLALSFYVSLLQGDLPWPSKLDRFPLLPSQGSHSLALPSQHSLQCVTKGLVFNQFRPSSHSRQSVVWKQGPCILLTIKSPLHSLVTVVKSYSINFFDWV